MISSGARIDASVAGRLDAPVTRCYPPDHGASESGHPRRMAHDGRRAEHGYEGTTDMVKTEATRHGPFDVIAASVHTPVVAGGADDTHEMLILTPQGELEVENAPDVIGLADLTGDGRTELVFRDVTVVSDMPNGPLLPSRAVRGRLRVSRE